MLLVRRAARTAAAVTLAVAGLTASTATSAEAATLSCVGSVNAVVPTSTSATSIRRLEFEASTPKVLTDTTEFKLAYKPVLFTAFTYRDYFVVSSDGKLHHLYSSITSGTKLDRVVGTGWASFKQIFTGYDTLYGVTSTGALRAYTIKGAQTDKLTVSDGRQVSASGWGSFNHFSFDFDATFRPPSGYTYADAFLVTLPSTGALYRYYINDGRQYGGQIGFTRQTIRSSTWQNMKVVAPVGCFDSAGNYVSKQYYLGLNTNGSIYRYSSPSVPTSTSSSITSYGVFRTGWGYAMRSASH